MRIKSCIGAGILALYAGSLCYGQNNSIDYSSYLHDVQLLMKTIVFIQGPAVGGSGVLVAIPYPNAPDKSRLFVVTAKHLLHEDSSGVEVFRSKPVTVYYTLNGGGSESRLHEPVLVFRDTDIMVLRSVEKKRQSVLYQPIGWSISAIADPDSVLLGQYVYVGGFPISPGVTGNQLAPVLMSGIVAQVRSGTILINVPISEGNSGGGVYTVDKYGAVKLLGVVTGYPQTREFVLEDCDAKSGMNTQTVPHTHSSAISPLGRVVSVAPIREYVKWLMEHTELRYVP